MRELLFELLIVVVGICGALFTRYLVPYLKELIEDSKYSKLLDIIEVAVKAAEQTTIGSGQGKIKKADVVTFVSEWLNSKGLEVTEDELNRLIEATVFAMNNDKKEVE